jgi:hypothetical protein
MRRISRLTLAALIGTLSVTTAAMAHHSFTQFDRNYQIVTTGTVVRWEFNNPHSWLRMNVPNDDGTETLWSFEASGPTSLITRGITGKSFEPGDTVTIMFCRMVDGRPGGHMGFAILKDGSWVNPSDGGCSGDEATIERWKGWIAKGYKSNKEAEAAE